MNKFIVMTTIHSPNKAIKQFCDLKDWTFIIVGDLKTPHERYKNLASNVIYLTPEYQNARYKELSDAIGWNTSPRRNIGFVEAYKRGAEILALVDDDNMPYDEWGQEIYVGQEIDIRCFEPENPVFDPLSITNNRTLWHRGYPIELVKTKNNVYGSKIIKRKVLVQANLWNGEPDVDAIERLLYNTHNIMFNVTEPYCADRISPFNSQNTFLAREAIPFYMLVPHTGRVDDIIGSYIFQETFPDSVIYHKATVHQTRNWHNLVKDLNDEMYGYSVMMDLINKNEMVLNPKAIEAIRAYRRSFYDVI